jgi:hypothetical protein
MGMFPLFWGALFVDPQLCDIVVKGAKENCCFCQGQFLALGIFLLASFDQLCQVKVTRCSKLQLFAQS